MDRDPRLQSRRGWPYAWMIPLGIIFAALGNGLSGCQQPTLPTDETGFLQPAAAPGTGATAQLALDTADFEIVDCLLPARISRLGRHLTFLGARRPIRTTGRDCSIRGGEYVAYDRADYATALKIWLPLAEQGDPEAQTYVGDIYERGLGRSPDYAVAANWYRRAAQQGYATAQVSLGQLYERGLGVPKDMVTALDLYREASGLEEEFEIVSAAELQNLQGQVDQSERRAATHGQQVDTLQQELRATRDELRKLRDDADAERESLELARRQLAEQKEALAASSPRHGDGQVAPAHQVEKQQAEREVALARRSQELDRRAAEIAAREAEHEQKVVAERASIQAAKRELEIAHRELAEETAGIEVQMGQLQAEREREADQQATQTRQLEAQYAELREHRATLEEREAALARQSAELDRRVAEVSAREAEHRQEAADDRASIQAAQRELKVAQRELAEQRAHLDTERREVTAQRDAAANERVTQTRQLEAQHAELQDQHAALEGRKVELEQQAKDLESRISEIRLRESEAKHKQDELAELNPRIRQLDEASQEEALIDYGKYYALVIGNGNYQSARGLETLKSPEIDAKAISALLSQKYGYRVVTLINAKRDRILTAINTLRETLTEHDNLLIYYAGHGFLDDDNGRGYWLPTDAQPYPQTANWISVEDITGILDSMQAKHVLVVADSCYSGSLTAANSSPMGMGVPQEERFYWLKTIANRPARMALTSGSLSPVLDGGGRQHSVFAMALLEVLGTNDHVMEGWRVYLRVTAHVSDVAKVYGLKQVPTYGPIKSESYAGGDFLFVRS